MEKQKQENISTFFAPKPEPSSSPPSSPPPNNISATVTVSPLKRRRTFQFISPFKKPPKISRPSSNSDLESSQNPTPSLPNPATLPKKFVNKLLELSDEDTRIVSTSMNTSLEQQVVELKAKYKDVLLMIEVGHYFRFFGEDAENAARVLGIYAHKDHNFLTASIPTFRLNVDVRRMLSAGYKVGVVKQTETTTIKPHCSNKTGPFCLGLSALYTKATLEAAEDVGGGEEGCGSCNNYLVCVVEIDNLGEKGTSESVIDVKIGIVAVEISTGGIFYGEFDDNLLRIGLEAKILSLPLAELLLGDPISKQTEKFLMAYVGPASNVRVERSSQDRYKNGGQLAEVLSFFDKIGESHLNGTLQGENVDLGKTKCQLAIEVIMGMPDLAVQALALTINHLKQSGSERILCLGASFRPFSNNVEMNHSANAMQQLKMEQPCSACVDLGRTSCTANCEFGNHFSPPSPANLIRFQRLRRRYNIHTIQRVLGGYDQHQRQEFLVSLEYEVVTSANGQGGSQGVADDLRTQITSLQAQDGPITQLETRLTTAQNRRTELQTRIQVLMQATNNAEERCQGIGTSVEAWCTDLRNAQQL